MELLSFAKKLPAFKAVKNRLIMAVCRGMQKPAAVERGGENGNCHRGFGYGLSYVAFLSVGSFCFSAYGIFLGFLCRNQASARTIGVIFYLPHLLPSALSDFSEKLTVVAPFLPSYQFYEPVKSILLEEGRISSLSLEWIYLLSVGLLTFFFAYLLMRKRWLM